VCGGGVAGQLPGDDATYPGVFDDLVDRGGDLAAAAAGFTAGQGVGQLGEFRLGLGQGLVEAAGLGLVQRE